jgi:hypothetical protein
MDEVAGLVLVDADPDDLEPEAMREEAHRGHAGIPSDFRDCRNAIAGPFFFRGLPEAEWSPELNAKVLEIAQTKVAMYDAYSSEMQQTASDVAANAQLLRRLTLQDAASVRNGSSEAAA